MADIEVINMTKDYGHGRGIFDISIQVDKGECYGFLGPNGAGKTTTIRHLMGFSKPDQGEGKILGMESFENAAKIKNIVGYLPGEIALPRGLTGTEFLKMMMDLRGVKSDEYLKMLLDRFELDPNVSTKSMSLGVKRKLAVVTAFMHDPEILILDEPTSGLDPVMQQTFIEYIIEEKKRGKTIFLSSHIFHEVDATCDRIAIIKDGRIVSEFLSEELKDARDSVYRIIFNDEKSYSQFETSDYRIAAKNRTQGIIDVYINSKELNQFILDVSKANVYDFQEIPFSLEDYFMQFYKNTNTFEEVK